MDRLVIQEWVALSALPCLRPQRPSSWPHLSILTPILPPVWQGTLWLRPPPHSKRLLRRSGADDGVELQQDDDTDKCRLLGALFSVASHFAG